jgi:hypothetical protein
MSIRQLLSSLLLFGTLWLPTLAVDSPSASEQDSYEAYLKRTQELYEAEQKEHRFTTRVLVAMAGGLTLFGVISASRWTKWASEVVERQQRVLEEIRDLLKKP